MAKNKTPVGKENKKKTIEAGGRDARQKSTLAPTN